MADKRYEKLSSYAKRMGAKYQTAWLWFRDGKIDGTIKKNGSVFVPIKKEEKDNKELLVATYARVSSSQNKSNLEKQSEIIYEYCIAKGYQIEKQVVEIGSGMNENRPKLISLFKDDSWSILVVEHKDRLSRFGFIYLDLLAQAQGRSIEVINRSEGDHIKELRKNDNPQDG